MINLDRFCREKKSYAKVYHMENGNYSDGEVQVTQLCLTLCDQEFSRPEYCSG